MLKQKVLCAYCRNIVVIKHRYNTTHYTFNSLDKYCIIHSNILVYFIFYRSLCVSVVDNVDVNWINQNNLSSMHKNITHSSVRIKIITLICLQRTLYPFKKQTDLTNLLVENLSSAFKSIENWHEDKSCAYLSKKHIMNLKPR